MAKKKTHEEFVQQVFSEIGEEYIVLGKYQGSIKKVKMKHVKCGNVYETTPGSFLNKKSRCKRCTYERVTKSRTKTQKQFEHEVFELVRGEYEVLGQYITTHTDIKIKHNVCSNEYMVRPHNFLQGARCSECRRKELSNRTRKSHESFVQEVLERVGEEYVILGTYKGANSSVEIKHVLCGNIYKVKPNNFLFGKRCKVCQINNSRKTHEDFVKEIHELVDNEYEILSKYTKHDKKVKIKHQACGNEYLVSPRDFLKGRRCVKCKRAELTQKQTRTHEQFLREVKEVVGEEYIILNKYKSAAQKVKVRHNTCGNEYEIIAMSLLNGNKCRKCVYKKISEIRSKSHNNFIEEVYHLVGDEYSVLSKYKNSNTRVKMKHNKCGSINDVQPNNFLSGKRCKRCAVKLFGSKRRKTHNEFLNAVYTLVGDSYEVLTRYELASKKVLMKHNECSHVFGTKPNNFLSGKRCPKCRSSKGERRIVKWLKDNNIQFEIQARFEDCKHIYTLPFDVSVYKNDGTCILIEYQGRHHYESVDYFGGEERLKHTQLRDRIKKIFCKNNNIPLLLIPYWEFNNIEEILARELMKHNIQEEVFEQYN